MNVRRTLAFHATHLLKTAGVIIGLIFLCVSAAFLWVGYSNQFFARETTSFLQRFNEMISSSPNAAVYVTIGVLAGLAIGIGLMYVSLNYIPVGRGQLDWSEYFDDLPWHRGGIQMDSKE